MAELRILLQRLQHWLEKHRDHYAKALLPGATTTGLPDELRTLLAWHDGQDPEALGGFENNWRLMSSSQIAEDKAILDKDAAETGWNVTWIPFLSDGYGNYLFLDTTQTPPPVRGFWAGNSEHEVIAKSLTEWMKDFVTAVEGGKYVEEQERGTFLRRDS